MKISDLYIVVVGIFCILAVMWFSDRFWSRSIFIKAAPIFAPAAYELILIYFKIRDASYLTFSRFGEMLLLGGIVFIAFILGRYEGAEKKKPETSKNEE